MLAGKLFKVWIYFSAKSSSVSFVTRNPAPTVLILCGFAVLLTIQELRVFDSFG